MKKITFNTLPEAISELIDRVEKIEKILSKKASQLSTKSAPQKKRKTRRQEIPAGLLSVKEAGKLLKMSLVNLYSYVKNKKIPFEKKGRRLYFSKNALENWNKGRNEQVSSGDNITIKDAVKLLKVPASTIYYKIKSQKLKPAVKRGNKLLFSKRELINAFSTPVKRGRKALKTAKPAKTSKAPKAGATGKAAKTSKSNISKTVKVSKEKKSIKPSKPAKSAQAVKPAKPVKTQKKAKAAKKVKPAKSTKPQAKVSKPSKPVKPAKPESAPKPEEGPKTENTNTPAAPPAENNQ
jgi:excisionase family DNA binding protein